jgi:hypothetical protein
MNAADGVQEDILNQVFHLRIATKETQGDRGNEAGIGPEECVHISGFGGTASARLRAGDIYALGDHLQY